MSFYLFHFIIPFCVMKFLIILGIFSVGFIESWIYKYFNFFTESPLGSYSHCQSLVGGSFCQQKEGSRSSSSSSRIRHRARRQLSRRRYLRTAAPPFAAMPGKNHGSRICGDGSTLQRSREKAGFPFTNGQSGALCSVYWYSTVMLRKMLSEEVSANVWQVYASGLCSANQPNG